MYVSNRKPSLSLK